METQGRLVPELTDVEIAGDVVRRMKAGDQEAFLELFDAFAPSLYGYLYLLLGERYGAAQATQDVLELAFDLLPEDSPVPIRVWLFWVAHRRAGATRTGFRDFDTEDADPLVRALMRLAAGVREAVVLRHVVGFSAAETGVVLDRSPRSIGALESRGLNTLGRLLSSQEEAPPVPPGRLSLRMRTRESPVAYGRRWALNPL